MHVFVVEGQRRIDPTESQLGLYGDVVGESRAFRIEATGQARNHQVRLPNGDTRRLALADRLTLEAAVEALDGQRAGQ